MPAGTTDSLGLYYWCKTASTTDTTVGTTDTLRELRNQSILSFDFRSESYPTLLDVVEGDVEVPLGLVLLQNVDRPLFTYERE